MSGLIQSHDFTPTSIAVSSSLTTDTYYICTAAGSTTQTLPLATNTNKQIILENTGTGTITLSRSGTNTINGATSVTVAPYDKVVIRDAGTGMWMMTMGLTNVAQTIDGIKSFNSAISSDISKALAVNLTSTTAGVNITTHSTAGDDFTVNTNKLVVEGDTGNIGIGTTSPYSLLSLGSSVANTKLSLFDNGATYYGMGVQSNEFRFHVGASSADFRFYDAPAGNALFTIKGTGGIGTAVGIGRVTSPAYTLTIGGASSDYCGINYSSSSPIQYMDLIAHGSSGGWYGWMRFQTGYNDGTPTTKMIIDQTGVQADIINEMTSTNGVAIKGRTAASEPTAGSIGEIALGSGSALVSGTGGYTYSIRSSNAIGTSWGNVSDNTLNKGRYLFIGMNSCYCNSSGAILSTRFLIGGTVVTTVEGCVNTAIALSVSCHIILPIVITADGTHIYMQAYLSAPATAQGDSRQEIWIMRIG